MGWDVERPCQCDGEHPRYLLQLYLDFPHRGEFHHPHERWESGHSCGWMTAIKWICRNQKDRWWQWFYLHICAGWFPSARGICHNIQTDSEYSFSTQDSVGSEFLQRVGILSLKAVAFRFSLVSVLRCRADGRATRQLAVPKYLI